jgi:carbon-monoxide dehydrogenase large subunit
VRSGRAHGRLISVDTTAAREAPGVRAVLGHAEIAALGAGPLKVGWNHPEQRLTETELLPSDMVRWVGQPIVVVLADSAYEAEDAAELVELEIEDLPPVTSVDAALADGAPRVYEDWPDNVLVEYFDGPGASDEVFDAAPVRIRERFVHQRQAASPMESRAALATYDADEEQVTAWISTQLAHHAREVICDVAGWPEHQLRVITPDVGGGFGLKEPLYAEDVLVCLVARHLRRPVRWIEDRREALIGSSHCRECTWDLELAADDQGKILGLRGDLLYDIGGQPTAVGIGPARIGADMLPGPYHIEAYGVRVQGVVTNKTPTGAYRGYGGPEAAFAMERLMDLLAGRVQLDPAEVRRRNFLDPEQFPYTTPTQHVYDSGDYERSLDLALERIDYAGFAERRRESEQRDRLRGIGICSFVQSAGLPSSRVVGMAGMDHGNHETITVRMDATGMATVFTGVSSQGQGHRTVLAQICADVLGLDPERDVLVRQGDTETTPYSAASAIASRVASIAGATLLNASGQLKDKLVRIAAHQLEAAEVDIELAEGHASVVGSGAAGVPIGGLARAAILGFDLPEGMEPGLEATATFDSPGGTYPFGSHVAEVEIDPATGALVVLRYVVANDCGTVLNPTIVEGQIAGAVAQGLGGALLEEIVYDEGGQILTATFMDYLLPTASEVPLVEIEHTCTPAEHVPGGIKGVGESGTLGPPAAVANAVADALGPGAPIVNRLPLTPPAIWALVRQRASVLEVVE